MPNKHVFVCKCSKNADTFHFTKCCLECAAPSTCCFFRPFFVILSSRLGEMFIGQSISILYKINVPRDGVRRDIMRRHLPMVIRKVFYHYPFFNYRVTTVLALTLLNFAVSFVDYFIYFEPKTMFEIALDF